MPKLTKGQYIDRLNKIYSNIQPDKQGKADELISRLSDVLLMMDECCERLKDEGCVTEMPQGNYSIMRENPYSKIYDAKHKLMLATIDKLDKLADSKGSQKDELMAFLGDDGA